MDFFEPFEQYILIHPEHFETAHVGIRDLESDDEDHLIRYFHTDLSFFEVV
jgi:hypothetical protein